MARKYEKNEWPRYRSDESDKPAWQISIKSNGYFVVVGIRLAVFALGAPASRLIRHVKPWNLSDGDTTQSYLNGRIVNVS